VRALLEGPVNEQVVPTALARVAVLFIGLGLVAAAWGMWRGMPEKDDPPADPPR
jgi:hypothetical protein